jgi:hypothetical protein
LIKEYVSIFPIKIHFSFIITNLDDFFEPYKEALIKKGFSKKTLLIFSLIDLLTIDNENEMNPPLQSLPRSVGIYSWKTPQYPLYAVHDKRNMF